MSEEIKSNSPDEEISAEDINVLKKYAWTSWKSLKPPEIIPLK